MVWSSKRGPSLPERSRHLEKVLARGAAPQADVASTVGREGDGPVVEQALSSNRATPMRPPGPSTRPGVVGGRRWCLTGWLTRICDPPMAALSSGTERSRHDTIARVGGRWCAAALDVLPWSRWGSSTPQGATVSTSSVQRNFFCTLKARDATLRGLRPQGRRGIGPAAGAPVVSNTGLEGPTSRRGSVTSESLFVMQRALVQVHVHHHGVSGKGDNQIRIAARAARSW